MHNKCSLSISLLPLFLHNSFPTLQKGLFQPTWQIEENMVIMILICWILLERSLTTSMLRYIFSLPGSSIFTTVVTFETWDLSYIWFTQNYKKTENQKRVEYWDVRAVLDSQRWGEICVLLHSGSFREKSFGCPTNQITQLHDLSSHDRYSVMLSPASIWSNIDKDQKSVDPTSKWWCK